MATLFVIMMTVLNVKAQNACIWGRSQEYNDFINGQYMHNGTINGAPWFKKLHQPYQQTAFVTLYLWRASNLLYYITNDPPTNNYSPVLHYGRCSISTNSPWECNSNWMVYNGNSFTYDSNVYSQEGTCPEWNCDAIDTTTINISPCNIIWQIKVGANAWSNTAGSTWFYFHPLYFRWFCIDKYIPNSLNIPTEYTHSEQKWVEITKGSSVNLDFLKYNGAVYDYNQYEIKCVGITYNPTKVPTVIPTIIPTNYPTLIPSDDPTTVPTSAPTKMPTALSTNPTLTPSTYPTFLPSNNPSVIPSMTPTTTPIVSTSNPTIAPTKVPTADPINNPTLIPSRHPTVAIADPTPSPSHNPSAIATSNTSKIIVSMLYIVIGCAVISIIVCIFCIFAYKFWKQKKKNGKNKNGIKSSINLNKIELSKMPNSPNIVSQNELPKMRKDRNNNDLDDEDESVEKLFGVGIDTRGEIIQHRVVSVSSGMSDDEGDNKIVTTNVNEGDNVEELYKGGIDTSNYTEKSSNTQGSISRTSTTLMSTTKRRYYLQWTADEVLVWIFGLDNGKYKKYGNELRIALGQHGVDGKTMPYVEKSDWRSFGITDLMDLHNLEEHVEKLVNGMEGEGQNIYDNL